MTILDERPDPMLLGNIDVPEWIQGPPPPQQIEVPDPDPVVRRHPARQAVAILAWVCVGFLVWCVVLSALPYARDQLSLDREFRTVASQGLAPVNQPIAPGAPVARIQIPEIGLDATVVEGSEARQLATGPGHLRTSVLPGQAGVSVVFGRRMTHGAPFRHLDQLAEGNRIRITNGQGTWIYRVVGSRQVPAEDASAFVAKGDTLLLVTADRTVIPRGRFVVTAKATKELAPTGTPTQKGPVTGAELGLQGDPTAATGLLVWLEVLVLLAAGTVVLHRRWGRWPTWLVAAPPLAAALWSLYESLGLLLPAAL